MAVKSYQNFDPIVEVDACGCSGIRFDINLNGWVKVTPTPVNGGADCAELEAKVTQLQQTNERLIREKDVDLAEIARLTEELTKCQQGGGGFGEIRSMWNVGVYSDDAGNNWLALYNTLLDGESFTQATVSATRQDTGEVAIAETTVTATTLPEAVKESWYTKLNENLSLSNQAYDLSMLTTAGVFFPLPSAVAQTMVLNNIVVTVNGKRFTGEAEVLMTDSSARCWCGQLNSFNPM